MGKGRYILASSSLLLGCVIYLLWRPDSIRFFRWLDALGLRDCVHLARGYASFFYPHLPGWIVFSLPNGLWAFSYALIISTLWWGRKSWLSLFWLFSIPIVGMGYEILQGLGIIPGTFCVGDLIFSACGTGFGLAAPSLAHEGGKK